MEYLSENLLAPLSAWEVRSPREDIALKREDTPEGVTISTTKYGDCGKLLTKASPVEEFCYYEYKVTFTLKNIKHPKMSTRFIVDTYTESGKEVQTDYAPVYEENDGVYTATGRFMALEGSAWAEVSVMLFVAESGSVTVKEASLRKTDPIPERNVRVATAYINPYKPDEKTFEKRFAKVLKACDNAGMMKADILALSEGIPSRELPRNDPNQFAEPIPGGYICNCIAEKAKQYGMWILVNTREVDTETGLYYNTTAIFNRQGEFHGKYRKCNITYAEYNSGLTPGHDYPVFDTDFGRIGTVTCFDQFFPESIRTLALKGAEIIFVPTAGDGYMQFTSRALENSIYMVAAGVNHSKNSTEPISRIVNPVGEIIAGTNEDMGIALATIDLSKPNYAFWFSVGGRYGDKKNIHMLERRPSTYGILTE